MTHQTAQLKTAYQRTGLAFLGLSFERAMAIKPIRISLECAVSKPTKTTGKPAPIQPALI